MSPTTAYHTYINCSEGLSAESVYSACKELACQMRTSNASSMESAMFRTFQDLGLCVRLHDDRFAATNTDNWIDILRQKLPSAKDYKDTSDYSSISPLILHSFIQAVKHATSKGTETINEPTGRSKISQEIALIGSIWWIHHLELYSRISCSPIPCSFATLRSTPELYKDLPVRLVHSGPINTVTHTGLALLKTLLASNNSQKDLFESTTMTIRFVASNDNSTTVVVGEQLDQTSRGRMDLDILHQPSLWDVDENLSLLETNVDDITAEHLAFATDLLMQQEGVLDSWISPIIMKKGRPAQTLHCLCRNEKRNDILNHIFRHLTTLGVRVQCQNSGLSRVALRRTTLTIPLLIATSQDMELPEYAVECKVAYLGNDIVSIKPEFEHCKRIAMDSRSTHTVQSITEEALRRANELLSELS